MYFYRDPLPHGKTIKAVEQDHSEIQSLPHRVRNPPKKFSDYEAKFVSDGLHPSMLPIVKLENVTFDSRDFANASVAIKQHENVELTLEFADEEDANVPDYMQDIVLVDSANVSAESLEDMHTPEKKRRRYVKGKLLSFFVRIELI